MPPGRSRLWAIAPPVATCRPFSDSDLVDTGHITAARSAKFAAHLARMMPALWR
jgi:hypothetical protein